MDHAGAAVDGQGKYAYVICAPSNPADSQNGLYRVALDQLTSDLEENRQAIVQVDPDVFFYPGDFDWRGQVFPLVQPSADEVTFALTPDGTVFYRAHAEELQGFELRGFDGVQRWTVAEDVNFFSLSEDGSRLLITQHESYDEMVVSLHSTDPNDTAIQEVSRGKARLLSGNEDFSALLFTDSSGTPYNLYAYRQDQRELLVSEAQDIVYAQAPDTYTYTIPSPPEFSFLFFHENGREVHLCNTAYPVPHYEHSVLVYTTFDPTDNQVYLALGDITGELWREKNDDLGYAFTPDGSLLTVKNGVLTRYQRRRGGYRDGAILAQNVFSIGVPQTGKAIYYSVLTGEGTQDLYRLDGITSVQVIAGLSGPGFFYPDGGIATLENGMLTYYTPEGTSYSYGPASEEGFCRLEGDHFLIQEDGVLTLWEGEEHWILDEDATGFYAPGQQDYLYAF
ncbi:MAG: hypothetical protein HFE97_05560 [Oscillospiraceae bacterium]|nr:hypothetical protein [Oscillospiraceae bacterium]